MAIVCGMDVHRRQITFDCLDTESGEVFRGVIRPATRERLRRWLQRFQGQEAAFAPEATTGWRFVVEELQAAGLEAHLASRPTAGRCGVPKGEPRPTARIPATSASCCRTGACRSPGSHPHTSRSCAVWSVCVRSSSISDEPGSSAFRPCSSTRVSRPGHN